MGLGSGVSTALLQRLATNGHGTAHFLADGLVFLGAGRFPEVQFQPQDVTICCQFFSCVSTYPKFPIEFLYDEIIVFSGESDSKEMLIHEHMFFSTENYVCDISHSHLPAAYSEGKPASGLNQNEGREKYV